MIITPPGTIFRVGQGPYTVPQLASDAAAVLVHAGVPRAHVLGVSLGAESDDVGELSRVGEERVMPAIERPPFGVQQVGGAALDRFRRIVRPLTPHDRSRPAALPEAM